MTLKEAIDILEKELECRNRLIEDAEYGIDSPCLFDCSACKYNTDSTKARDALSLLLDVARADPIGRQAAIDALKEISFSHWFECGEYISEDTREMKIIDSNKALKAIDNLQPAQPEQKVGKWIMTVDKAGFTDWLCSSCGGSGRGDYRFCPWCRAKMKE